MSILAAAECGTSMGWPEAVVGIAVCAMVAVLFWAMFR